MSCYHLHTTPALPFHPLGAGGTGTTWIVKPTSLNRGNGIEVFNSLNPILEHVNSKKPGGQGTATLPVAFL